MSNLPGSITIDGTEYVPRAQAAVPAVNSEGLRYVIIRTFSAGVHAGYLKRRDGKEVTLVSTRRIWMWAGAATLSQLATDGTSKPKECKFPAAIAEITLTEAIEIIPCTEVARKSIEGVCAWKQ